MTLAIVAPPVLPPAALAELKAWIGITTTRDDAELVALLHTALEICAAFTGSTPLVCAYEEQFAAPSLWHLLAARPVQAITSVEAVTATGARMALPVADYAVDLQSDGTGQVRLLRGGEFARFAVRFTAGLASDWDGLPAALRHGVIRLAAHAHRQRDVGAADAVPAAVAALWRPYRRVRLS